MESELLTRLEAVIVSLYQQEGPTGCHLDKEVLLSGQPFSTSPLRGLHIELVAWGF
jgi:hypothetical protein